MARETDDMARREAEKARQAAEKGDKGLPGGGAGRKDVTGMTPKGIRVDPDLTEGHPGYDESGRSEVRPSGQ